MAEHTLGDAPIEPRFRERMQQIAGFLDEVLNGNDAHPHARGVPDVREVGFVLLVFPFNDHDGSANYISNGADRRDIVALFKEQIARFEGQPEIEGRG